VSSTEVVYGMMRWSTRAESFALYGVRVAAMTGALLWRLAFFADVTRSVE